MREIKISLETATRWYNGKGLELKELAIQAYPELVKKELPKTWKELSIINGYFVNPATSSVSDLFKTITTFNNKNVFATREQAEASIAMAQLSQLIAVYNDGWIPDYTDKNYKWAVFYSKDKPVVYEIVSSRALLTFSNKETAELFLENFKDLILTAKPLL